MFRKILTFVTLVLLAFVVWNMRAEIAAAIGIIFNDTNPLIVLLLIPEQLFMYYCAGQMFFTYMAAKKGAQKIPQGTLVRIAFELNFVNHAIPSGGVSGLGYLAWRLKPYGATPGQVSFMYALRYVITILANQTQTLIAILILILSGTLVDSAYGLVGLVSLISLGIIFAIAAAIIIASSKKRINWFSKISTRFINSVVKFVTFGRKTSILSFQTVNKFFLDFYDDLMIARRNKKMLLKPLFWGVIYNFFEIATYEIIAISMGHPEIFPQIMVAEAIGSLVGAVMPTPGGAGGYEASMAGTMALLGGVTLELATAVVVATRVLVLIATVASGYGFYQGAINKIGQRDKGKVFNAE